MMNNMRKPTALKQLAGNPGKRPLPKNEPEYPDTDLIPPLWLPRDTVKYWHQLAQALDVNGMLNQANKDLLGTYCVMLTDFIAKVEAGEGPDIKLVTQLRLMGREFGFTPSAQSSVMAQKKDDDPKHTMFFV